MSVVPDECPSEVTFPTRNAEDWHHLLTTEHDPKKRRLLDFDALLNGDSFGTIGEPPDSVVLRILGLEEEPSSRAEVKEAFRRRVKEVHPDLREDNISDWGSAIAWGTASTSPEFQEVVWARDVLLKKVKEPVAHGEGRSYRKPPVTAAKPRPRSTSATHNTAARIEAEYREWRVALGHHSWLGDVPSTPEEWADAIKKRLKREAEWSASLCGKCGRDIASTEPVSRSPYGLYCSDCANLSDSRLRPCKGCDRPTVDLRSHRYTGRAFCCEKCKQTFWNRRRQQRLAEGRRRSCETCGTEFSAKRSDSLYCSPACRQKAYRGRKAAAPAQ